MLRWNGGSIGMWALVVLLAASAPGQPDASPLKPGDALPRLAGQAVTGKPLDLPTAAEGEATVVIFSFSRAGGRDAKNWAQHFSKDHPQLPLYLAIFLEAVPRMFRSMAVSGIKSGMPPGMHDRTMLLYQQQTYWEHRLQIADEDQACVLMVGPTGQIQWMSPGPFSESIYQHLSREIRP